MSASCQAAFSHARYARSASPGGCSGRAGSARGARPFFSPSLEFANPLVGSIDTDGPLLEHDGRHGIEPVGLFSYNKVVQTTQVCINLAGEKFREEAQRLERRL